MQLAALDTAQTIEDMDIPGFRLLPLKGELQGRWSRSLQSLKNIAQPSGLRTPAKSWPNTWV